METANSMCPYVQIRFLEKYEEDSFKILKVAEYLKWKIQHLENGDIQIRSGDGFPLLQLGMADNETLIVMELKSEFIHGSTAIMQKPVKVKFEHFIRFREHEEEVRSVVIYNSLGCYIMLKDEITLQEGRSASDFLAAYAGELNSAV